MLKQMMGDGTKTATASLSTGDYLIIDTAQTYGGNMSYASAQLSYSGSSYSLLRTEEVTDYGTRVLMHVIKVTATTTVTATNYGYDYAEGTLLIMKT